MKAVNSLTQTGDIKDHYDVIVAGAGSGGISAAIQAARMGAETLLIEPTNTIGGQLMTVPTMDEGHVESQGYPIRNVGLYAEFLERVHKVYRRKGKSVGTCYWRGNSVGFEPRTAENVLKAMLFKESCLTVIVETKIKQVTTEGTKVVGIVTSNHKNIRCKILIDATEYGDIIPLTPARYRVGKTTNEEIDPDACLQDITYPAVVQKYPGGAPDRLIIDQAPPKYEEYQAQFNATINLHGCDWYPSSDGEQGSSFGKYPTNWITHNAYRGIPDSNSPVDYSAEVSQAEKISKTIINWANDYPVNVSYLENPTQRELDNWQAKLKTLNFIYYLQQELGNEWAVAEGEYKSPKEPCPALLARYHEILSNFPPYPYVRESRRIIPIRTLTGADIKRTGSPPKSEKRFTHSTAVGYYPADLHGCKEDSTLNLSLENNSDFPEGFCSGPFQIPFEALIPEKVDGFLAAEKNIGVTRIAAGAVRLQPITMVVGQVVGMIAGLAVRNKQQPREVPPLHLQKKLLEKNHKLFTSFYSDVPRDHPLWAEVELVSTHGLLKGTSSNLFGLDKPLSRAEFRQALNIYLGDKNAPDSIKEFKPGKIVTREEAFNLFKSMIPNQNITPALSNHPPISKSQMQKEVEKKKWQEDFFNPIRNLLSKNRAVKKAEAVVIFSNLLLNQ